MGKNKKREKINSFSIEKGAMEVPICIYI